MPRARDNENRRVTLRDIALRLEMSHTTVSRALNGVEDPYISQATRERVRQAAQEMGYRPNHAARTLATGRTGLIALWLWSMRDLGSYHAAVGQAMYRAAASSHYQLLIDQIAQGPNPDARKRGFDRWNVDGIIAHEAAFAINDEMKGGVRPPVPLVATGVYSLVEGVDQVVVDMEEGVRAAVEHLVAGGRRNLVYVTDDLVDRFDDVRYLTFVAVLEAAGIQPRFLDIRPSRAAAREGIKAYVADHGVPDALFCHNDDFAIGAYRGLCDLGVKVPHDTAIVGCDGIEDCEYFEVPISSVALPFRAMSDNAVQLLHARIDAPDGPLERRTLAAELVIRASSS